MTYLKISIYGAGLTLLWASIKIILPVRLLDFVSASQKNTYLGIITFLGLLLAIIIQPLAGAISDRSTSRFGPRRPHILIGTILALLVLPGIGWAASFVSLLIIYCLLQVFSNIAQASSQGFIPDLIPEEKRGLASGIKSLAEALVPIALLPLVAYLIGRYFDGNGPVWLWLSIGFLGLILLIALIATILLVKEQPRRVSIRGKWLALPYQAYKIDLKVVPDFPWYLLSRLFPYMAIGALGTYAVYLLQDMVHIPNPAAVAGYLTVTVGVTTLISVYAGGRLSDKIGRKPVLIAAGLLGAIVFFCFFLVHSFIFVLILGSFLGIAMGSFLSTSWALATDLVPPGEEARYLGLTNLATAGATALAQLMGPMVDFFNARHPGQGYSVLVISWAALFVIGSVLVLKIKERKSKAPNLISQSKG